MKACSGFVLLFVVAFWEHLAAAQNCSNNNPCPIVGKKAKLPIPTEHVSSNGELQLNLTVDVTKLQMEWFTYWRRTFNGKFPAPTWRVKQGDRIKVHLKNNLSPNQPTGKMNEQRFPNGTNIHTHGLHISSKPPGDNVFTKVQPGASYDYIFDIDPENPAGTYWYHPHLHGSTFLQVQSGMAGMIIVEDPTNASTPAHIQAVSCPNNCQHDIPLLLQPAMMYWSPDGKGFVKLQSEIKDDPYFRTERFPIPGGKTLADWLKNQRTGPYLFTVNGELLPTLDLTTGIIKRFRMVNAGGNAVLEMTITGENATPLNGACQFLEIAVDGVYLDKAVRPKQDKSYMVPATRVDWLVVCDRPGIYEVRSLNEPLTRGDALGNAERFNKTLFYLNVTGLATTTTLQTSLPKRPWFVGDFRNLTQAQVKGRHVVEVNPKSRLNRLKFQGEGHSRFQVEVNSIQEWYITNTNDDSYHPIHIHINHFQVISYNKYTGPVTVHKNDKQVFFAQDGQRCFYQPAGYLPSDQATFPRAALEFLGHENKWWNESLPGTTAYSREGVFRDTIHVPPMSNITIRFAAHKYTGSAVVHCHILKHEDKGMMYTFEITEPGVNVTVDEKAGNGYPGQCMKCDPYPFNEVVHCGANTTPRPPMSATATSGGGGPPPVGAGGQGPSGGPGTPPTRGPGGTDASAASGSNTVVGREGPQVTTGPGPQPATGSVATTLRVSSTSGATKAVLCKWSLFAALMTALTAGLLM